MPPLEAWLCLRGLATLSLRMEHHCASAAKLAEALAAHPSEHVHYPGLPDHPQHEVAARQLRDFGGTLAFEVAGGLEAGAASRRRSRSAGSGEPRQRDDAGRPSRLHDAPPGGSEARREAGIGDGLLRVAVGLEDPDDLVDDFMRALDKA